MALSFRIPKINDPDDVYKILHAIADQATPELVRAFINATMSAKSGIPVDRIERYLKIHDIDSALDQINWEEVADTELTPDVRKTLRAVFEAAGENPPLPVSGNLDFDIVNPRAIDYIRNEVGTLITNVNAETIAAVRDTIRTGFENGRGPRVMAEEIADYIGLNRKQAGAFIKYKDSLTAKGISGKRIEQLSGNYYKRLLKERGLLIARTETINAASAGYREQLIQASEQNLLDANKWVIEWLVTPDDRLCPLCRQMSGKRREITGTYQSGPGAGKKCPTLHPRCRCSERTVRRAANLKMSTSAESVQVPNVIEEAPAPKLSFRVHGGNVSPEFKTKIDSLVDFLPDQVKKALEESDVRFFTGPLQSAIRPSLKGVHPPGWPAGWTWDACEGSYWEGNKVLTVSENVKRYGKITKNARVEGTFFHETGHAYDASIGMSKSDVFMKAYRADRKGIIHDSQKMAKYKYFMQKGTRGPKEAFAEAFAHITGVGSGSDVGMVFDFPEVFKLIREHLGK